VSQVAGEHLTDYGRLPQVAKHQPQRARRDDDDLTIASSTCRNTSESAPWATCPKRAFAEGAGATLAGCTVEASSVADAEPLGETMEDLKHGALSAAQQATALRRARPTPGDRRS